MSTHNLILEDQFHTTLMTIPHSPATSTTTGLMCKRTSILNQISEVQCHTTLIQTQTLQASSIMIGLIHNFQRMSTHNLISEDQFHTTLMTIPHSPATSTTT